MYQVGQKVLGNWTIAEEIGEGSFGKVFAIRREDFGTEYSAALKVIRIPNNDAEIKKVIENGMGVEEAKQYFRTVVESVVNEFALMVKFKGMTNVVSYEDHMVLPHENGFGWDILIRMELLTPLLGYAQEHPFKRQNVIQLGIDMCRALELCQKYNIIHRDIKPDNIFVSANGDFKLGDFGIARTLEKTTGELSRKGTYNYMAPEVYRGEDYGFSVDLYSLGIVMYRLLNQNRVPFMPDASVPIKYQHGEQALIKRMKGEPMTKPYYHQGRLPEIVLKACSFNPKERYSSPKQMRQELESIQYSDVESEFIYPVGDQLLIEKALYASISRSQKTLSKKTESQANVVTKVDVVKGIDKSVRKDNSVATDKSVTIPRQKKEIPSKKTSWKMLVIVGVAVAIVGGFLYGIKGFKAETTPEIQGTEVAMDQEISAEKARGIQVLQEIENYFKEVPTGPVEFENADFAESFCGMYGFTKGEITYEDLYEITELSLDTCDLQDISDLAQFINLKELSLQQNNLSDITPLENLTNLEKLDLSYNEISDITPLANLTNMMDLQLYHNEISDITPLANLKLVRSLIICDNEISDITPLENLTNLDHLNIYNNQISDLTPLTNLTKLDDLSLNQNEISDITPLANLTKLQELRLEYNQISDITPLANLTKLYSLWLSDNQISDISTLENLTSLEELELYSNQISDITPLLKLTKLEMLEISGNTISEEDKEALKAMGFGEIW